jgi:hypothetical protein
MYRVGTAARILKVVKLNGNNVNLIIQGHPRSAWTGSSRPSRS